jgi:hypothetical protein
MYRKSIVRRARGQRLDKPLLGEATVYALPEGATYKVVGKFKGRTSAGQEKMFQAIEVTYNGWIVPAYRQGPRYKVCQNFAYKAVPVAGAAPTKPRKPSTPEQRAKRRAAHWRKTGVSASTVAWMKDNGML